MSHRGKVVFYPVDEPQKEVKKVQKPKKKTLAEIKEIAAKRKDKLTYVVKPLKSGTLTKMEQQIADFAQEHNVPVTEVKVEVGWGSTSMTCKRPETDKEKIQRIKREFDNKYMVKLYEYDRWVRDEEYKKKQAAIAAGKCPSCGK